MTSSTSKPPERTRAPEPLTYAFEGRAWRVLYDGTGRAVDVTPADGGPRDGRQRAFAAYLSDEGRFAEVYAAIRDAAKRPRITPSAPVDPSTEPLRTNPRPIEVSTERCPSCEGSMPSSVCSECGYRMERR